MAWNNSENPDQTKEPVNDPEDDLYEQNAFSGWKKPSGGSFFFDLLSSPYIWVGAAALFLILLLIVFLPGSSEKSAQMKLAELSQKVELLENRIFILENNLENLSRPRATGQSGSIQEMEQINSRLDRIEASFNQRVEQLSEKIDDAGSTSPAKKESRSAASKPVSDSGPGKKFHTVKKGETLYRISRIYDVSIDKLRKLNNLRGNTVFPDQKILISP